MPNELWLAKLRDGDLEEAWSLFMDRYRRLTFAMIRRYTTEHDEVMDVFAHICERLRANDLARLRKFEPDPARPASFSTWLVTVERNLIADWFRARDGRQRGAAPDALSPLEKRIYDYVFVRGYSHREAYELTQRTADAARTPSDWQRALLQVHRIVFSGAIGTEARPVAVSSLTAEGTEQHDRAGDDDTSSRLHEVMLSLDPDVRLAVQLFVVDELPAADIARMLKLANAKAVYNKVYRGLAFLREALAKTGIHPRDISSA